MITDNIAAAQENFSTTTPEPSAPAVPSPAVRPASGRVPTGAIGRVLGSANGHDAVSAVYLLAVRCQSGPYRYGLNLATVRRTAPDFGRRRFDEALVLLRHAGVMERHQPHPRGFAVDRIVGHGGAYVRVMASWLTAEPAAVALALVALMSPRPMRPADAAARLGITAPSTVRRITAAALACGAIESGTGPRAERLIGRPGTMPTQADRGGGQKRVSHFGVRTPPLIESTPTERGYSTPKGVRARQVGVLRDWQASKNGLVRVIASTAIDPADLAALRADHSLSGWLDALRRHGGAPSAVASPRGWMQATEIAASLASHFSERDDAPEGVEIMHGLARIVAELHRDGAAINGMSIVAVRAAHTIKWEHDWPSRLDADALAETTDLAAAILSAWDARGLDHDSESLTGLDGLEALADLVGRNGEAAVMSAARRCPPPREGYHVSRWAWLVNPR